MSETFDGLARKPEQDLNNLLEFFRPKIKKGQAKVPYIKGSLKLEPTEAAWLAAMLDGEGSVCINTYIRKSGYKTGKPLTVLKITFCYNTEANIILKTARLIPWANVHIQIPSGFSAGKITKPCYGVESAQRDLVYDFILQVSPYMAHARKKAKAEEILAHIDLIRTCRITKRAVH